jgi:ABC-type antimicrobial peptide transport system permease subunit
MRPPHVAGLAVAAALSVLLRGLLFGLSPLDPVSYVAMAAALLAAALGAMYLPSRRAAAIDPAAALRVE